MRILCCCRRFQTYRLQWKRNTLKGNNWKKIFPSLNIENAHMWPIYIMQMNVWWNRCFSQTTKLNSSKNITCMKNKKYSLIYQKRSRLCNVYINPSLTYFKCFIFQIIMVRFIVKFRVNVYICFLINQNNSDCSFNWEADTL